MLIILGGNDYYPSGAYDYIGIEDTVDKAVALLETIDIIEMNFDFIELIDTVTKDIIDINPNTLLINPAPFTTKTQHIKYKKKEE